MTGVIRWEDPPDPRSGRGRFGRRVEDDGSEELAAELRSQPGTWAVVFEGDNGPANTWAIRIRWAFRPPFEPRGDFDALTRKGKGATVTAVYARYVGQPS
jgi:hypothetical protein